MSLLGQEFALRFAQLETRTVQRGNGMSLKSAAGQEFLKTLENWMGSQTEALVLIRYSRAASGLQNRLSHSGRSVHDERL